MIDHNRKVIFIHVPKCAGTSVEHAFGSFYQDGAGHTTLSDYLRMSEDQLRPKIPKGGKHSDLPHGNIIGEQTCDLDEYFKFTFVRNPWAKMVSSYHHYCNFRDIDEKDKEWNRARMIGEPIIHHFRQNCKTFKDFLHFFFQEYIPSQVTEGREKATSINPDNAPNFTHPYVGEASHRMEQWRFICPINKMDFIGTHENIKHDFRHVCERLGLNLDLPHSNKSKTERGHYSEYYDDEDIDFIAEKYKTDIELFNFSFNKGGQQ